MEKQRQYYFNGAPVSVKPRDQEIKVYEDAISNYFENSYDNFKKYKDILVSNWMKYYISINEFIKEKEISMRNINIAYANKLNVYSVYIDLFYYNNNFYTKYYTIEVLSGAQKKALNNFLEKYGDKYIEFINYYIDPPVPAYKMNAFAKLFDYGLTPNNSNAFDSIKEFKGSDGDIRTKDVLKYSFKEIVEKRYGFEIQNFDTLFNAILVYNIDYRKYPENESKYYDIIEVESNLLSRYISENEKEFIKKNRNDIIKLFHLSIFYDQVSKNKKINNFIPLKFYDHKLYFREEKDKSSSIVCIFTIKEFKKNNPEE